MPDIEIEHLAPAALRPWAKNARTHSRGQIRRIADSIGTFGFTSPVLIDEDNRILAGHGRVAAARLIGMDAVPCLRLTRMTAEAKRAYVLADNRLALDAGWDAAILAEELRALQAVELDFDIAVTGFTLPEIDKLAAEPVPEEPPMRRDGGSARRPSAPKRDAARNAPEAHDGPARCRPGDVWRLGPHRLICGGASEADAAACDRILRCWDAFSGERSERIERVSGVGDRRIDGRTGEAA
jgi:hypothetical protein